MRMGLMYNLAIRSGIMSQVHIFGLNVMVAVILQSTCFKMNR